VLACAVGCSSSGRSAAPTTARRAPVPPRLLVHYGHVASLKRTRAGFELRLDPAEWLSGVTAERAALEDGAIDPSEGVSNDYYVVEEGHRLLTYLVPPKARVTVVTGAGRQVSTRISVAELAQIVRGRNPRHRTLYDRKLGFWIAVAGDRVRSLDQQYQP
jgi:hypothetical protein